MVRESGLPNLGVQLGNRQGLFGEDGDERILHFAADAAQFLDADQLAGLHRPHHGTWYQGVQGWPFRQEASIIPSVTDRFFRCAGGALHDQGGIAGDGSGEVLRKPGFGGAGNAEQEERLR